MHQKTKKCNENSYSRPVFKTHDEYLQHRKRFNERISGMKRSQIDIAYDHVVGMQRNYPDWPSTFSDCSNVVLSSFVHNL